MRALTSLFALVLAAGCSGPSATPSPHPSPTAAPTPSATPSAAPLSASDIVLIGDGPVLEGSDLDAGDHYGATLPAAYFIAEGMRHLYVVGFGDVPGDQKVFHATSADGLAWTVDEADPFADLGLEMSPPGPLPGSVLEIDGQWVMYLWGVPDPLFEGARLYRAVAPGPGGPWVADPEPVVPLGEPTEVDDRGLDFPSVVQTGDGFLMLYGANGGDRPNTARVLAARSADGVAWEKLGRVMEPQLCGGHELDFIAIPRLFGTEGNYLALTVLGNDVAALTSSNGTDWSCVGDQPLFRAGEIEGSDRVHTMAAASDGDQISLIIEALLYDAGGSVYTNLWLANLVP